MTLADIGKPLSYFTPYIPTPLHELLFTWASVSLAIIIGLALLHAIWMRFVFPESHWIRRSQRVVIASASLLILLVVLMAGIHVRMVCLKVVEAGGAIDPIHVFAEVALLGELLIWLAGAGASLLLCLLLHWSMKLTPHIRTIAP